MWFEINFEIKNLQEIINKYRTIFLKLIHVDHMKVQVFVCQKFLNQVK